MWLVILINAILIWLVLLAQTAVWSLPAGFNFLNIVFARWDIIFILKKIKRTLVATFGSLFVMFRAPTTRLF